MEGITVDSRFQACCAKKRERNKKNCAINQNIRKQALYGNTKLFFNRYIKLEKGGEEILCLCGHILDAEVIIVHGVDTSIKSMIGSQCLKKYLKKNEPSRLKSFNKEIANAKSSKMECITCPRTKGKISKILKTDRILHYKCRT